MWKGGKDLKKAEAEMMKEKREARARRRAEKLKLEQERAVRRRIREEKKRQKEKEMLEESKLRGLLKKKPKGKMQPVLGKYDVLKIDLTQDEEVRVKIEKRHHLLRLI